MSYPTIENAILEDGRISEWLADQIVATRDLDLTKVMEDIDKLKFLMDRRVDRLIKERKTFKTKVDISTIKF